MKLAAENFIAASGPPAPTAGQRRNIDFLAAIFMPFVAILVAVACGIGIGIFSARLKFNQHQWTGGLQAMPDTGARVAVDQDVFNFGRMDFKEKGLHNFVFTNRGDHVLTLKPGATSCSCTVSEFEKSDLAPGESAKVPVTWQSKKHIGRFEQNVTILTNDPQRPEVSLTIKGQFTQPVYADPDELTFGEIAPGESVTRETLVLCTLPGPKIKIEQHSLSDPSLEQFFQIETSPLGVNELKKQEGVMSGVRLRVTTKPGLPLGRFPRTINLGTNLAAFPEFAIPLFGSVGDVSVFGRDFSSESGLLDIGAVDSGSVTQRILRVLARGLNAKNMRFNVKSIEPDFVRVKLGKMTVDNNRAWTDLIIEIPASKTLEKKAMAKYMDATQRVPGGKPGEIFGEIVLETIQPPLRTLRIRVRFVIPGGISAANAQQ